MIMVPKSRNNKGSILALTTALAMALVVVGLGFFFFTMYMGAQKETKNAVDAGTLNVGKQALDEVSVQISPTSTFFDVTSDKVNNFPLPPDCDGKINLRRVNRMWAKAMLYKINAMGAKGDGTSSSGDGNASDALQECENVSNQLANKLKNQTNLHDFFTDIAKRNSVRMIGTSADVKVISGNGWQTSTMKEGKEGNVVFGSNGQNFFLPPGFDSGGFGGNLTPTTRNPAPQGANGLNFLKGYSPIKLGGDTFWQVPFLFDEKPHMVARSDFDPDQSGPSGWSTPIPNAFSAEGVASQPGRPAEKATSWMLTNPRQTFKASIPSGFVHIKLEDPVVNYYFLPHLGAPHIFDHESTYGFIPKSGDTMNTGLGTGNLSVNSTTQGLFLGQDLVGRSLDDVIFAGNHSNMENNLTARCNEMISKPGVTISKQGMHNAIGNAACRGLLATDRFRDFYVYSPDGENIHCLPSPACYAPGEAPWLAAILNSKPDGKEKSYNEQTVGGTGYGAIATPDPYCFLTVAFGIGTFTIQNYWQSGTGTNHCLGRIRCLRSTNARTTTICAP